MSVITKRQLGLSMVLAAVGVALSRSSNWKKGQPKFDKFSLGLTVAGATLAFLPTRDESYMGKSVVISGGSRGLGFEMARQLIQSGAKVTLLARDPDELERAAKELCALSRNVFTVVCDVTRPKQFETALAEARARFGSVDMLIHNAGAVVVGPFASMNDADFEAQIMVHLYAAIDSVRAARPYFRMAGEGRVLMISSIGGQIPIPHMAPYCASKFALAGFAESIRGELAKENISLTVAYPGLMRTGSLIQAVFKGDHQKEFTWFAVGDYMPGLSMSAETAARRMLHAALYRRASIVVGAPAKLAAHFYHLFPETFAAITKLVTQLLPDGQSQERHTGAESREVLNQEGGSLASSRPLRRFVEWIESSYNQAAKDDAEFNLGVKSSRTQLEQASADEDSDIDDQVSERHAPKAAEYAELAPST